MHKALYGLKQAPRAWNKKIDIFLRDKEFVKCITEHGIYVIRSKSELLILCLYVDDLLITSTCKKEIDSKVILARNLKCLIWATFYISLESNSTREVEG